MATQYYRTSQGNYQLDKVTGIASKIVSIPSGAPVINWGASNLPPELQSALGQERTAIGQTLGFSPNIAYGAVNTSPNYASAPNNFTGTGRYIENPGLLKGMSYEQAKSAIVRQEGWPTIEEQWSTDRQNQISDAISRAGISKPSSGPTKLGMSEIDKYINDLISTIVSSGKTVNPNLTENDLKDLDPSVFLEQAEASIAPEYREKFQVVKDSLTRKLTDIGYDFTKRKEDIQRTAVKTIDTGEEELAGRGLAFSGAINKFRTDVPEAEARDIEAARTLAFRGAQEAGSGAEEKIGTTSLQQSSLPSIEGRSPFSFSSSPLMGSLTSERQYLKESLAKELEKQYRERRAYTQRSLAFS